MARYNTLEKVFTAGGRRRARREKIAANMSAQQNSLFMSNSKEGRQAWEVAMGRKTSRPLTQQERKTVAADQARAKNVVTQNQQYFNDVKGKLKDATPEERNVLRAEARERFNEMRNAQETLNFDPAAGMAYSRMDRVMAGANAVGQYYLGGTARQNIARIGGTAGAIYGANVGIDYLNSRTSGGGYSGSGY